MGTKHWIGLLLVGAIGAVGAAGCGDDETSDAAVDGTTRAASASDTIVTTTASAPEAESTAPISTEKNDLPTGEALFSDSFDDDRNGWGVIDDPTYGSTSYVDGNYTWVFRGSVAHWLPAVIGEQYDLGELDMLDVVVRAQATVDAGDGVIGVFCRDTPDTDADWQWYEFVARDGYAAIRLADTEGNIDVLAESDDVMLPSGEPITIEGVCRDDAGGDAQLALTLNGTRVLSATDDAPLGNGASGLQAWTFPIHEEMDIRWHEFTIDRASP